MAPMRKTEKNALDLRDRVNELETRRHFLQSEKKELCDLEAKLKKGDKSVVARVKELGEIIAEDTAWINRNIPIVHTALR